MLVRSCLLLLAGLVLAGCAPSNERESPASPLTATDQTSGTDALLIGLSPVNERVVWASGTGGTVVRTTDGGATWQAGTIPGADSLQFRDVHGVSADTAFVLSIGSGAQSRIYKTTDGGSNWTLQFQNDEPEAFFDCMDFWDAEHGLAFSDPVDGAFVLIRTDNGGETWTRIPADALPPALDEEASFAASGTCLVTRGDSTAFFTTGGGETARIIKTTNRGRSWTAAPTPVEAGASTAGIASMAFHTDRHGAAMGGLMVTENAPDSSITTIALTNDGGATWTAAPSPELPGIFGGAFIPNSDPPALVVAGPEGLHYSLDDAQTWQRLRDHNYWSVAFADEHSGWAVGTDGRISKLTIQ